MARRPKIKNYSGRNFNRRRTADCLTRSKRSSLMSKIRSRNTAFEEDFKRELKKLLKGSFDSYCSDIKGKPDFAFRKQKVCLFLDSDFWHGWQYPRWRHLLKDDFWRNKIERNRFRDRSVTRYLRSKGWKVVRIWEHALKCDSTRCVDEIRRVLQGTR